MREKGFSQPELQRIFNILGEDTKYVKRKKIKIITVDPEVRDVFTRNSSQNAFSELQKNVIVVTGIPYHIPYLLILTLYLKSFVHIDIDCIPPSDIVWCFSTAI